MKGASYFIYAVLLLALSVSTQSCTASRMPVMLNCSKQGRGGVWIEVDTVTDSDLSTYNVSQYKSGEKQGRHYAYRRTGSGLMWRCEKGRYRHGQKAGLWLYYTTCGYYINWVYYLRDKQIHYRVVNSVHALDTCPCDKR